uniref:Uncharacterized protein n=1 Tax=Daphnia galeata TaxID=27404 RepID=A0A8J2WUH2_9CRUS|nr:unnamed protein product [Daphnia galeata]
MSLKKIRRRLSQTFRFSIESSLSELAEHLTIEESNGEVKNNGIKGLNLPTLHSGMHHTSTFTKNHRRLSLSHSRIIDVNHRPDSISSLKCLSPSLGIFRVEIPYRGQAFSVQKRNHFSRVYCWQSALSCKVLVANHSDNVLTHEKCTENNQITRLGCAPA